jgi:hypothetical protein
MKQEVKVYQYTCDRCGKSAKVTRREYDFNPPKGWGRDDVHDCGLTGYTRTEDLCPACVKKLNKDNKKT